MEMPAVFAAIYLLGYPDHYTSHEYTFIFMKHFLAAVATMENTAQEQREGGEESIEYNVETGSTGLVLTNQLLDYIHRPAELEDVCVVEFFCLMAKKPKV